MREYRILLLQYQLGDDVLNRFYARSDNVDLDAVATEIKVISEASDGSLEDIARKVEQEVLNDHDIIGLHGIKRVCRSYDKLIAPHSTLTFILHAA